MTQTVTIKDPAAPASLAQVSYLNSLVTQRDLPAVCERYALMTSLGMVTKGQASEWINALLKAPKKTATFTAMAQPVAPVVDTPQLTEMPAFGYYVQADGTLLYWDVTSKDSYPMLRRLVIVTNYDGSKKGQWIKVYGSYNDIKVDATFKPYGPKSNWTAKTGQVRIPKALVAVVTAGIKVLAQGEAAKLSKQFGFCIRCGATLTDPKSVAAGLGPVCQTYWG